MMSEVCQLRISLSMLTRAHGPEIGRMETKIVVQRRGEPGAPVPAPFRELERLYRQIERELHEEGLEFAEAPARIQVAIGLALLMHRSGEDLLIPIAVREMATAAAEPAGVSAPAAREVLPGSVATLPDDLFDLNEESEVGDAFDGEEGVLGSPDLDEGTTE